MSEVRTPPAPAVGTPPETPPPGAPPEQPAATRRLSGLSSVDRRMFGPANISIVYLYVIGFVMFSLLIPDLWLSATTPKTVLNVAFAIPGLVALALVLPLLGGVFDLSIAGVMSLSVILVSVLMVRHGWSVPAAIAATIVVAAIVGALNGVLVVTLGIDSFIATLGSNAVLLALAEALSGGIQITHLPTSFQNLASFQVLPGIQGKIVYLVVVAAVLWYLVEHTPFGRYVQATGSNREAARLAGVRVNRYQYLGLIASASIAGLAGVVHTANVGAASADAGSSYLLPAFAAAFLGSTQFKGRFNVVGTLVAIWVLASGVQGVTLAIGSFAWLNNAFFGAALIVAVGLSRGLVMIRDRRLVRGRRNHASNESRRQA